MRYDSNVSDDNVRDDNVVPYSHFAGDVCTFGGNHKCPISSHDVVHDIVAFTRDATTTHFAPLQHERV